MDKNSSDSLANKIIDKNILNDYRKLLGAIIPALSDCDDCIVALEHILNDIKKHCKNVKIARGVGAGVGVVAAPVVVGSLIAAPFTGGLSLVVALGTAAVSGGFAAAGVLTNGGAAAVGAGLKNSLINKADDALKKFKTSYDDVRTLYERFYRDCDKLQDEFPHLKRRFSIDKWVGIIASGCTAGFSVLKSFDSDLVSGICKRVFNSAIIPGLKDAISKALIEASGVVLGAFATISSSPVALAIVATIGIILLTVSVPVNIYTLISVFDDSPSDAEQEVGEQIEKLRKIRYEMKCIRDETKSKMGMCY